MRAGLLALVIAAFSTGACGPAPVPVAAPAPIETAPPILTAVPVAIAAPRPDESFREHPPAPGTPHPFVPPKAVYRKLSNGIPVVVVRQPSPFVAVRIVAAGGLADVGVDKPEVVNEMVTALKAGTERLSHRELQEVLASLAMPEPQTSWHWDYVSISGLIPVPTMRAGIAVLADLALRPSFQKDHFERWRGHDALLTEQRGDAVVAEHVLRRALFGTHRYAASLDSPARIRAVTRADVVSLHARLFVAPRLLLAVAGPVEEQEVVTALEGAFGGLTGKAGAPRAEAPPPPPSGPRLVVVDKPGTTVATVTQGALGPAYGAADMGATWLAFDALTDTAVGRLPARLHSQLAQATSLGSNYAWMRAGGLMTWQTHSPTDQVAPLLVESDRVLRKLAASGIADDDLADVKSRRVLAFAAWFETSATAAREFSLPMLYRQPESSVATFPDRFATVSPSDARTAAARYLDADRVRTVIVGDWSALQGPLTALAWGSIEVRTADGAVVAPRAGKASP